MRPSNIPWLRFPCSTCEPRPISPQLVVPGPLLATTANIASKLKDKLAYAIIWVLTADAVDDHVDAGSASVEPAAVRLLSPICTSWVRTAFVVSLGSGLRLIGLYCDNEGRAALAVENRAG
jgi:hypothetical protein